VWLLNMFRDQKVADILTKPLAKGKFEIPRERRGLVENTFFAKRERNFYLFSLNSFSNINGAIAQLSLVTVHNRR
jgi:hypothetical protein